MTIKFVTAELTKPLNKPVTASNPASGWGETTSELLAREAYCEKLTKQVVAIEEMLGEKLVSLCPMYAGVPGYSDAVGVIFVAVFR